MKITFDTTKPDEVEEVRNYLAPSVTDMQTPTLISQDEIIEPQNIQTSPENRGEAVVDLDANGMAWDETIHASSRTQTAKGFWKVRSGTKALHDEKLAAHKAGQAITATEVANTPPAPTMAPTNQPAATMPNATLPNPTPAPEILPLTYDQVSSRFLELHNAGHIPDFHALYAKCGITDPNDLVTNDTLRQALWAELDTIAEAV